MDASFEGRGIVLYRHFYRRLACLAVGMRCSTLKHYRPRLGAVAQSPLSAILGRQRI